MLPNLNGAPTPSGTNPLRGNLGVSEVLIIGTSVGVNYTKSNKNWKILAVSYLCLTFSGFVREMRQVRH